MVTYTNIDIVALSFTLTMGILTLFLPRRFAFVPILIEACYITLGQRIIIATADFTMLRIILLFGLVRIIIRGEISSIKFNTIDKILISYVLSSIIVYSVQYFTFEAFMNRLGFSYDTLGLYFFFRVFIRDFYDIEILLKLIGIIIVPLAIFMLFEKTSGNNLFYIFGGVPLISMVREGSVRCQGSFAHPILAGTFGATLIPFFIALWFQSKNYKKFSVIGFSAATIIAVTPISSGPVLAYLAAILGMIMWYLRKHMKLILWSLVLAIISLHFIMKAPVWFLIDRIGDVIGGTGWHRAALIDEAIKHFNEWWLLGTDYTRHWMPTGVTWSPDHTDITNQFIRVGIDGGIITLILFILLLIFCFRGLGTAIKMLEGKNFEKQIMVWSMGAALFAHMVSFLSVRYFDQTIVFWNLLLAMISSISIIFANNIDLSEKV
jgi:hypothetical protein